MIVSRNDELAFALGACAMVGTGFAFFTATGLAGTRGTGAFAVFAFGIIATGRAALSVAAFFTVRLVQTLLAMVVQTPG